MDKITEQDIINAIVALDANKLEEISNNLRAQYTELYEVRRSTGRVCSTLKAAGFVNCKELSENTTKVEEQEAMLNELSALVSYCNAAIKELTKKS